VDEVIARLPFWLSMATSVSTMVLAILTFFYLRQTARMAAATEKQVQNHYRPVLISEGIRQYSEPPTRYRDLPAQDTERDSWACVVLTNHGAGPALNIQVQIPKWMLEFRPEKASALKDASLWTYTSRPVGPGQTLEGYLIRSLKETRTVDAFRPTCGGIVVPLAPRADAPGLPPDARMRVTYEDLAGNRYAFTYYSRRGRGVQESETIARR